jgi:FeoB-associated Cys-rich membrane protein
MQDLVAISIVAVAAGYLTRQMWLRFARKKGGSCGSCPNCGANDSLKSRELVNISLDGLHQ